MAITITNLMQGRLSGGTPMVTYTATKALVVKSIRLVNVIGVVGQKATVNMTVLRPANDPISLAPAERRILPKDTSIPVGYSVLEGADVTLEKDAVLKITGNANCKVDYVVSGILRDPP